MGAGSLSLRLVFIQIPSPGSDNGIAGEERPGPPLRVPPEAQTAALPPLTEERLLRSLVFVAWYLPSPPAPTSSTWGHPRTQSGLCPSRDVPAVDAQCVSSPSPDAFESWGQSRIWVGGGLKEATSAGWIDPGSRRKDWAPCRGRGCHGCSRLSRREEGEEWSEAPPRGFWKYLDTDSHFSVRPPTWLS